MYPSNGTHVFLVSSFPVSKFLITYFAFFPITFCFVSLSFLFIFIFVLKSGSIMYLIFCASSLFSSIVTMNGLAVCFSTGTLVSSMMYSPYASLGLLTFPSFPVFSSSISSPSSPFS